MREKNFSENTKCYIELPKMREDGRMTSARRANKILKRSNDNHDAYISNDFSIHTHNEWNIIIFTRVQLCDVLRYTHTAEEVRAEKSLTYFDLILKRMILRK